MTILKNKNKRRKMFIEIRHLEKKTDELAKYLITTGNVAGVMRGIEILMRSPNVTGERKGFTDITEFGTKITTPPDTTSKERISAYISTVEYSHNIPLGKPSPTKS
jgi:hypothetical protein